MSTFFNRLDSSSVVLPPFVKGMILLAAIPPRWDTISFQCLQALGTDDNELEQLNDDPEYVLRPEHEPKAKNPSKWLGHGSVINNRLLTTTAGQQVTCNLDRPMMSPLSVFKCRNRSQAITPGPRYVAYW
ncbi:hypothetical protein BD779DRAFT_1685505 [Infundibulicybe gibba]|nr:hypothetical protein BD779DRAFT_1685505 [Infundibulicybe gibba]